MLLIPFLLALAQAAPAAAAPPAGAPAPPAGPFVALEVVSGRRDLGTITLALDAAKAPLTVANFLAYVREGHYDGTLFHRVIPGFVIQGGGYTPEMQEKPTRPAIRSEARNGLRNARGTVAMARLEDPQSATAQFFFNLRTNHMFDFGIGGAGYTVFGRVVAGMDVLDRIATFPTTTRGGHEDVPEVSVVIKSAREVKGPPAAAPQAEPAATEAPPQ